jgi:glycosyltransferase involved in cell wall biosynthesis
MLSPYRQEGDPVMSATDSALNRYTRDLCRALHERGIRVSVLTARSRRNDRRWDDGGLPIVPSYRRGTLSGPWAIARALRRRTEPILHVQFELNAYGGAFSGYLLLPVLAAYRRKMRIVTTIHGLPPALDIDAGLIRGSGIRAPASAVRLGVQALGVGLARVSDHIVVPNAAQRALVVNEYRAPPERVSVIHNGTDAVSEGPSREDSRRRLGLSPDAVVLLFFGFWSPFKRLDLLVPAVKTWLEGGENRVFILAGSVSPRYSGQKTFGEPADVRRLRTPGFVPDEEVASYFRAADALVLPYGVAVGTAALGTSLAYDLPVLASKPLAADLAFSTYFDLSHDSMVEALQRFAEEPEFRERIKRESLALKATRTWAQHAASTERIYEALAPEPSRSAMARA